MPSKESPLSINQTFENQREQWRTKLYHFINQELKGLMANQETRIEFLNHAPQPNGPIYLVPYSDVSTCEIMFAMIVHEEVVREPIPGRVRLKAPRWHVVSAFNLGEHVPKCLPTETRDLALSTIIELVHAFALKELNLIGEIPVVDHPSNNGPVGTRLVHTIEFKFRPKLSVNVSEN